MSYSVYQKNILEEVINVHSIKKGFSTIKEAEDYKEELIKEELKKLRNLLESEIYVQKD